MALGIVSLLNGMVSYVLLMHMQAIANKLIENRSYIPYSVRSEQVAEVLNQNINYPKTKMFVKEVIRKTNDEIDLVVTDGHHEVVCKCWESIIPTEQQEVKEVLSIVVSDVRRSDKQEYLVSPRKNGAYHLRGKVVDTKKSLISVGDIIIGLGIVPPEDINDFVEFCTERLDCVLTVSTDSLSNHYIFVR
jgi:hypothetical protein